MTKVNTKNDNWDVILVEGQITVPMIDYFIDLISEQIFIQIT
jgi:hypothetical protein